VSISLSPSLDIYSDSGCTRSLVSIDWGAISPGGAVSKTIYVKNTGSAALTLNMVAVNWDPSDASKWLMVTWDWSGRALDQGESTPVTLTLHVASEVGPIQTFSVQILISGA
jgi:hypothetical protein